MSSNPSIPSSSRNPSLSVPSPQTRLHSRSPPSLPPQPNSALNPNANPLSNTLDILSRWASLVSQPTVYQQQTDEEFWRSGPGGRIARGPLDGETAGVSGNQRNVSGRMSDDRNSNADVSATRRRRPVNGEFEQGPSFRLGNGNNDPRKEVQHTKTILLPVRVEPKVQFANERTFLGWMHYVSSERRWAFRALKQRI